MKYLLYSILSALVGTLLISCNKNTESNPEVPQSVIDKSITYFEGEVIEKGYNQENEIDTWEVKIQNAKGAVVEFYWTVNGQMLHKMEGKTGPFDYEIMPGNSLINFSTAQTIAIGGVKNDDVLIWKLNEDSSFINKWIYYFEFDDDSSTIKVFIDASNGDILEID